MKCEVSSAKYVKREVIQGYYVVDPQKVAGEKPLTKGCLYKDNDANAILETARANFSRISLLPSDIPEYCRSGFFVVCKLKFFHLFML